MVDYKIIYNFASENKIKHKPINKNTMEKLIRLMANGRMVNGQSNLLEEINEVFELIGVTTACMVVLSAMALF